MVIEVRAQLHTTGLWILIPVLIGDRKLNLVLDSGSPASSVSRTTYERLVEARLLETVRPRVYLVRRLTIGLGEVADVQFRISRRVTSLGLDGLLGLDFLGRFTDIHFHVPSMQLTLSDEPS